VSSRFGSKAAFQYRARSHRDEVVQQSQRQGLDLFPTTNGGGEVGGLDSARSRRWISVKLAFSISDYKTTTERGLTC
jgi:hypothetical protein